MHAHRITKALEYMEEISSYLSVTEKLQLST